MAINVFGDPIIVATLDAKPEYEYRTVTRLALAREAMLLKNADGKDTHARRYVEDLKRQWPDVVTCTLCLVYNATGGALTIADNHDWDGKIGWSPYPTVIANGQWGAFLHVQSLAFASVGAVVYQGLNSDGDERYWMVSWENQYDQGIFHNKVYTEASEAANFYWATVKSGMDQSGCQCKYKNEGCYSIVATGSGISTLDPLKTVLAPVLEAIFTLEGAL